MRNYPRRGGRLSLECSCDTRVADWALTPWGDRLYALQIVAKGERCRVARHTPGIQVSARERVGVQPARYYDTRTS